MVRFMLWELKAGTTVLVWGDQRRPFEPQKFLVMLPVEFDFLL